MARTILIYGNSRTFKTSNCGYAAEYLYEKSGGKPVRLVSADKGDPLGPLANLVERGIVIPFLFEVDQSNPDPKSILSVGGSWAIKYTPSLLVRLSSGYWPNTMQRGRMQITGTEQDFIAPGIGNDLSQVSGYIFEGLTSFADMLMEHVVSEGRKINEDVVSKFQVQIPGQGSDSFGSGSRGHVGWVQNTTLQFLRRLPNLGVERVLVTAHEASGVEDDTKSPIRGPAVVGKAVTSKVLRDAGTCIHAESYDVPVTVRQDEVEVTIMRNKVRMFFESHADPIFKNVPYLAGPRLPPEKIPFLREKWPASFFSPGLGYKQGGLDEYLRVEDELIGSDEGMEAWKKRVLASKGEQAKVEVKK